VNKYIVNPGLTHTFYRDGQQMLFTEGQIFEAQTEEVKYALEAGSVTNQDEQPNNEKKGGK